MELLLRLLSFAAQCRCSCGRAQIRASRIAMVFRQSICAAKKAEACCSKHCNRSPTASKELGSLSSRKSVDVVDLERAAVAAEDGATKKKKNDSAANVRSVHWNQHSNSMTMRWGQWRRRRPVRPR